MLSYAEKALVFKRIGYAPGKEQKAIHSDTSRIVVVAGGERGGKSKTGSADLTANALDGRLFWIVGPDYKQARPEFQYCLEDFTKLGAVLGVSMPQNGPCVMQLRGGIQIETKTGDESMKLASFAPDGILMVEAAQQPFENFQKLSGRLAEKRGWMKVTGTFESSIGWYADMYEQLSIKPNLWDGSVYSLPTWSNLAIFPGGINDPEIKRLRATYPEEEFLERFGGIPCPPKGLVFREYRNTVHAVPIEFGDVKEPTRVNDGEFIGWRLPQDTNVFVWVDPGYASAYAVLFVAVWRGMVFHFDEVYAQGMGGEDVILESMNHRDTWERLVKTQKRVGFAGVIDIAGRQHQAAESQYEVWERVAGLDLRSNPIGIPDGISRHRTFLKDPFTGSPRLFHDPRRTRGTLAEYGKYKYREVTDKRAESELPIDAHNHSMKALAYGLVEHYGFVDESRPRSTPRKQTDMEKEVEKMSANASRKTSETGWLA